MSVILENDSIIVTVSEHGAELKSVKSKRTGIEYIWQADPEFWGRTAPNLFPVVGRLKSDRYTYRNKTYFMTQHGFARDNEFEVVSSKPMTARLRLTDSEDTAAIYPFKFQLDVIFHLTSQDTLGITYAVTNVDTKDIFFSVGGHPAFNIPLNPATEKFEDYYFNVEPQKIFSREKLVGPYVDFSQETTHDTHIPTRLSRDDYQDDAIILRLDGEPTAIVLAKVNESHGVTMHIADAKFVGIWTKYNKEAPFLAIEPWWGIADTVDADGNIAHKFGINQLAPAQTFTGSYSMSFF